MRRQVLPPLLCAVATAQPLAFEAVSIKPHPEPINFSSYSTSGTLAKWTASTLMDLIAGAYDLNYYQITGGPSWAGSDHFDIVARGARESALTKDQFREMTRATLADRFQLGMHLETREMPVLALLVGKGGPKLQAPNTAKPGMRTIGNSTGIHITTSQSSMAQLADQLSATAGRPVIDRTGLGGVWAFRLDFNPGLPSANADSDPPPMSVAVQGQLGLKLESATATVDILVIEKATKPSEN
jgi:uncharacterized protein (TIGR03435 family)